jgi:hypothetical protein
MREMWRLMRDSRTRPSVFESKDTFLPLDTDLIKNLLNIAEKFSYIFPGHTIVYSKRF